MRTDDTHPVSHTALTSAKAITESLCMMSLLTASSAKREAATIITVAHGP
jgi:hypothetical protein